VITSSGNARLKLVRRLASRRAREKLGLFSCEGEDIVEAALDAGIEPVEVLVDADRPVLLDRLPGAETVEPALLAEVSALGHAPRVIGVFRRDDLPRGTDAPVGLALWHVSDPGNVGTLLRTADALGPAFVALSSGCADPTGPKALRASAGAIFRVPTAAWEDVTGPRVALVTRGEAPLWEAELPAEATFVLGAEREGLPEDVAAGCDLRVSVPLAEGAESLNVAMAGTIALYEHRRRSGA
jgi:TrmH family RNA methyltransferase